MAERKPTLSLGVSGRTCDFSSLLGVLRYLGTALEADSGLLQHHVGPSSLASVTVFLLVCSRLRYHCLSSPTLGINSSLHFATIA
jgi:hypothetical protein